MLRILRTGRDGARRRSPPFAMRPPRPFRDLARDRGHAPAVLAKGLENGFHCRQATEEGVARIVPLLSERTIPLGTGQAGATGSRDGSGLRGRRSSRAAIPACRCGAAPPARLHPRRAGVGHGAGLPRGAHRRTVAARPARRLRGAGERADRTGRWAFRGRNCVPAGRGVSPRLAGQRRAAGGHGSDCRRRPGASRSYGREASGERPEISEADHGPRCARRRGGPRHGDASARRDAGQRAEQPGRLPVDPAGSCAPAAIPSWAGACARRRSCCPCPARSCAARASSGAG